MPYADTDFFLALIKQADWLKSSAKILYDRFRNKLYTSATTVIEVFLVCERYGLDPEIVIGSIYQIAEVYCLDRNTAALAAHYIKHKNMNVFDGLHAAFCGNDQIISSDSVYDKIGLKRIELRL